jgi:hypothetical protein
MRSRTPGLDRELVAHADTRWRKVARILFQVMDKSFPDRFGRPHLIASRIQALVKAGALDGRGI